MTYKLGELFCGPGGLALGAKLASVRTNKTTYSISHGWATDYDKDTCETYRRNICPDDPRSVVHRDIRHLDYEYLASISDIDVLAFGFPCNDFSVVGEQKGINGVYGPLYAYGVKAVRHFRPKWFIAENVGGLRNSNEGKSFDRILRELRESEYEVVPHLYKFEQYGVPQARHRIIIIGIRNDLSTTFNIPSPEPYAGLDVSSKTALSRPPLPINSANHEFTRQSETVIERLKHIRPGENAFTAELPKHLRLNVKGAKISQIYRRLD
ncbi:MAG: DNA (cytosine-5-)-methyltransferase, partial [Nitrososphaera sp.]|nr:DNA (cytosine-5-)-methyltransferase [Nitrososphaera sp.]